MAKIASKAKRLSDVVLLLEKGMTRKEICETMRKVAKVNPATTDRLIREAKIIVEERNAEKEAIRQAAMATDYKEALNESIISDIEIEAILCKLVTGNMQVQEMVKGVPVLRDITPTEIIQAAKTLYVKRGSNAPTKSDFTSGGEKLTPSQIIRLSNGQSIDIG